MIYHNLEHWNINDNPILLITGVSGAGKSTLARELQEKNQALYFELDHLYSFFFGNANNYYTKFLKGIDIDSAADVIMNSDFDNKASLFMCIDFIRSDSYLYNIFKYSNGIGTITKDIFDNKEEVYYPKYIEFILSKDKINSYNANGTLVIIEGVQLAYYLSSHEDILYNFPVIIVDISINKSIYQVFKRGFQDTLKSNTYPYGIRHINTLWIMLKWLIKNYRYKYNQNSQIYERLKSLKNQVHERWCIN